MPSPTLDGAHARLEVLEEHVGEVPDFTRDFEGSGLLGDVAALKSKVGTRPDAISGKNGSGILLYLHNADERDRARSTLDAAERVSREKWRTRWTFLATVVTVLLGILTAGNLLRGWFVSSTPAASPAR